MAGHGPAGAVTVMPRQVSADGLRSLFAQETDHVWLPALCLKGSSGNTYLIANSEDVTLPFDLAVRPAAVPTPIVYSACPFSIKLAVDDESEVPYVSLTMENIGLIGRSIVKTLQDNDFQSQAYIAVVRGRRDPSVWSWAVELGPTLYDLLTVSVTVNTVEASLGFHTDFLNEPATVGRFSPAVAAGLFL